MKLRLSFLIYFFFTSYSITVQAKEKIYMSAFNSIDSMLIEKRQLNFQKVVYLTENAFFENQLNEQAFNDAIRFNTSICRGIIASGNIEYPEKDKEKATAQCAVFVQSIKP